MARKVTPGLPNSHEFRMAYARFASGTATGPYDARRRETNHAAALAATIVMKAAMGGMDAGRLATAVAAAVEQMRRDGSWAGIPFVGLDRSASAAGPTARHEDFKRLARMMGHMSTERMKQYNARDVRRRGGD